MFTGARYKAIGVLAAIMENSKYDRDKINAAKELLAATKTEGVKKIELDIGSKEDSSVSSLMDQLAIMAARQKMLIESGAYTVADFGAMKIINKDLEGESEVL